MRTIAFMICLFIFGCILPLHAVDSQQFLFGVSLSLSGEFTESGKKALAGVKLRVDDYNNNHRKAGQPKLDYIVRDDKSSIVGAQNNMKFFAEEKIPAVIGPLATKLVAGMREIAEKEEIVVISPSVTSPQVGKNNDWVCRLLFDDEFQGKALARYLVEQEKAKRAAAIINDRLTYPNSVFSAFKKEFERLGGTILSEEHYTWVANEDDVYDFTTALLNTKRSNPDIVLLPLNSVELVAVISQATRMDLGLKFCGGDTWMHEMVPLASGHDVEDSIYITGVNFQCSGDEMAHFKYLYEHSNDPDLQMSSIMGYDAVSLLIEALKNGTSARAIRGGLYSIKKFRLALGTITVHPERGSEKTAYIHQIIKQDNGFAPELVGEIIP